MRGNDGVGCMPLNADALPPASLRVAPVQEVVDIPILDLAPGAS